VFETEPVGEVLDQRAFFNCCLRVETALSPEQLLDACKAVEAERGRVLAGEPGYRRHGPRPLDVDLLLFGEAPYRSERLELPHREVSTRRFVLVPLLELDPDLAVPGRGTAADALSALGPGQHVKVAGAPLEV
jgi:2-amino-4-hydroxy-6-hydroxymethyldihydropteridine diphosphokinase